MLVIKGLEGMSAEALELCGIDLDFDCGPNICPVCHNEIKESDETIVLMVDCSGPESGPSPNDFSEETVHLACKDVPLHLWGKEDEE